MLEKKINKILYLLILYFLNISMNNLANGLQMPNIVATVDNTPITSYEFIARKKFVHMMDGQTQLDLQSNNQLNNIVLKSLIDDYLFINEAVRSKMLIKQEDLDQAIIHLESMNKLSKGEFIQNLKDSNIDIDTVMIKLKAQIIRQRIAQAFAGNITVSNNEVTQAALLFNKEISYKLSKITSFNDSKKTNLKFENG